MLRHILILWALGILGCTAPSFLEEPERVNSEFDVDSCCHPVAKRSQELCPQLRAYWDTPPNIRVCDSVDVSIQQVSRATEIWKSLGYEFGEVTKVKWELRQCQNAAFGDILIRLPTQSEILEGIAAEHLATTKTYTYNPTGQVRGADIWFVSSEGSRTEWVLEHEIGHALGWMHCSINEHIMNPYSGRLGSNASGASYADYKAGREVIREVLSATD